MLQKSRKVTVLMLATLVIYSIIANRGLINHLNVYYFIVNPLFWIFFILGTKILLSKTGTNLMIKSDVTDFVLIGSLVYIGVYILSMTFVEIGENPYSLSLKGILMNLVVYILPIVAKEYIRFRLVNNVFAKDKGFFAVLIVVIFSFLDIGLVDISDMHNVTKLIFSDLLPIIAVNAMCTYMAYNRLWIPCVLYRVITTAFWLVFPILPKVTWIMISVIDTIIPVLILVYIRYIKMKKEVNRNQKDVETTDPKSVIPLSIMVVVILWFGMGVFPVRPIAIATGSMEKTIGVGDVVILLKCSPNDVEVGDVVQYQRETFTVVHRVVSKYYDNDQWYFITKGDNNKAADPDPVGGDQIIAKELFNIKYIGYPSIFLNKINCRAAPDTSGIEKGQ